ncbi:hypothetical protein [Saccharopolyspora hordei]|uniref:Divalent metal cation (Fe/Co/Zn/Cd) transporter n=1 Tax=Saccharopolyspora hordei TaxID=1838 RepID=A0A853AFN4_9PSEU|nr:hypothetical protein [Saccharopolyspora hordei]NYI82636.1 divalent metal cation (Fe/Co/Zn/Cd) transporter [Saccharopolyspora hordei]
MADERNTARRDSSPDLVTLVGGLAAVTVAGALLFGLGAQVQWLLALTAVVVGVLMLAASLRTRS